MAPELVFAEGHACDLRAEAGVLGSQPQPPGGFMRCRIGDFTWDLGVDRECPNHGFRNRFGVLRTGSNGFHSRGDEGPHDVNGVPYLGCCSESV
jgi:hypothetical protein